jgi:hypothetical protein
MPLYIFENPQTKERKEIVQRMTDVHEYEETGVKWVRVFESPQANTTGHIDPFSAKDFVEKTRGTRGTVGDLWDRSAELSEKRKQKMGHDPIKEKSVKDYEKKTGGKEHPHAK